MLPSPKSSAAPALGRHAQVNVSPRGTSRSAGTGTGRSTQQRRSRKPAARHPCRRLWRACADRQRLAVILQRGASLERAAWRRTLAWSSRACRNAFPKLSSCSSKVDLAGCPQSPGAWTSTSSVSADEVPHLKRKPSEYVREHFWFTTQPSEEPDNAEHLRNVIEWIGIDRLLFSSDYPHWDFDDPRYRVQDAADRGRAQATVQQQRPCGLQVRLKHDPPRCRRNHRYPARRQQGRHRGGREIVVFHVNGEFFALLNAARTRRAARRCGVRGAADFERTRASISAPVSASLRCPWHGWEYDMRTGQSYFDPVHPRSVPIRW